MYSSISLQLSGWSNTYRYKVLSSKPPACVYLPLHFCIFPLQKYKSTMVIVSHDRIFLNNVSTDIIHLANRRLTYYRGSRLPGLFSVLHSSNIGFFSLSDYDTFEQTRMEQIRNMAKQAEAQEHQRQHLQQFIDKFRFNAKRASLVRDAVPCAPGPVGSMLVLGRFKVESKH